MSDTRTRLPEADNADPDGVQVALRAAHTLWSHGDTAESLRWLSRAAESASDEGADVRSLQLAKAAAELRAQLFGRPSPAAAGQASRSAPTPPSPPPSARPGDPASRVEPQYADAQHPNTQYPDAQHPNSQYSEPQYSEPRRSDPASTAHGAREAGASPSGAPVATATPYPSARPRAEMRSSAAGSPSEAGRAAKQELSSTMMGVGFGYDDSGGAESVPPPYPHSSARADARASFLEEEEDEVEAEALPDDADMDDEGLSDAWLVSREPAATQPSPADSTTMTGQSPLTGAGMLAPPPLPREAAARSSSPQPSVPASGQTRSVAPQAAVSPRSVGVPPSAVEPAAYPRPPARPSHQASTDLAEQPQSPLARTLELGAMSPFLSRSGPVASQRPEAEAPPASGDPLSGTPGAAPSGPAVPSGPQSVQERERGSEPESTASPASQQDKLRARVHHQAVRVAVAPHGHADGQYVFRLLREGEVPAGGERVGLLVALEPGSPLV